MHDQSTRPADRRRQTRYAAQCRVVAISTGTQQGIVHPVSIEAVAEDISFGGARLLTKAPFHSSRLWLRFATGEEMAGLIECQVIRAMEVDASQLPTARGFYEYGLRFRLQLSQQQLARLVEVAAAEESA